jgi:hypothetical protein
LPDAWTVEVTLALLLAIVGFVVVLGLDHVASRKGKGEQTESVQTKEAVSS